MNVPSSLLDNVRDGKVVLVLGAGASVGATNSAGEAPPTGTALAKLLSDRFLGGELDDNSLPVVAELAISESDLLTVQEYIRIIFQDFQPAAFHELLPTFKWAGLATTNYDLVIERAYEQCKNRAQELVPLIKNGDRVEERLSSPRSMMLLKLHGCITRTADSSVPLILSVDQYLTHRTGRDRVFDHLKNFSYEHTLVFVGHSLQDPDIRELLLELGGSDQRPRYYTVTPELSGPELRLWESKRISPLLGTFEEFLRTLDSQMSSAFRGVVTSPIVEDLPIADRFVVRNPGLSSKCLEFLENDVDYVRSGMPIEEIAPKLFYRGFNPRWAAVDRNLDVRRDLEDSVLLDAILDVEGDSGSYLFVIKGHAGSGKSVFLQRVAWESALQHQKLCLYLRPHGQVSFDPIRELSKVIDERIYLFIDDIDEHVGQAQTVIEQARSSSIKLTIFGASRTNEWNMSCEELEPFVRDHFEVRYLSPTEIEKLLNLLETHDALFRLEQASREQRQSAFLERAGRQLLVALHEATLGKPFEDIVEDEFHEVRPDYARQIYLGICFLNRYDVPVRAGIISRVYGVRFTEFRERFFEPLEGLVFTTYDGRTRDYVYETRHPHIAEIVVEKALSGENDRLDIYLQTINSLNIDYDADRRAFRRLVQGRSILDAFANHSAAEQVYNIARLRAGEDSYLLHQMAIYEMQRPNGNLNQAAEYLSRARILAPQDRTITHSLAELHLKRAENAPNYLEFQSRIREAQVLARSLTGSSAVVSHGYHTLAKSHIAQIRRIISDEPEGLNEVSFSETIKDVEEVLQQGLQKFPYDSYLLATESDLGTLLSDDVRARKALELAFQKNAHNPFIVARLGKVLERNGLIGEALEVYKAALDSSVSDKQVHFSFAKLLIEQGDGNGTEAEYHLRRAFTEGDSNREAQFLYARQLYVNGKIEEAQPRFRQLQALSVNPVTKRTIRGTIRENGEVKKFTGRIGNLYFDYGFVFRDGTADRVYLHITNVGESLWNRLGSNTRLTFAIGFNFWGATAIEVSLE